MPLLEIRNLVVRYGEIEALRGATIAVEAGRVVTLLGANGAGKSTTLRAIMGLVPPNSDEIRFRGRPTGSIPTFRLVRSGLTLVPEGRAIFANLSVRENLEMGAYARRDRQLAGDFERVFRIFPRLKERDKQTAGTLSGGEQQMLAMARALMSKPTLLLLDEPSMGLAPLMVQKVFETVLRVSGEGVTILLIEQNAKLALEVSHRGYVMESGEITLSGPAKTLLHDPAVRAAYLGEVA